MITDKPKELARWGFKSEEYRAVVKGHLRSSKEPYFVIEKLYIDALGDPSWHLHRDNGDIDETLLALLKALEAGTHTLSKRQE